MFRIVLIVVGLACWLTGAVSAASTPSAQTTLVRIAQGAHRSDADRGRDAFRHPVQTLLFFDLRDDMSVVEIWPGAGWYTRILAPFLKDTGKLYLALPAPPMPNSAEARLKSDLDAQPALYGKPEFTRLDKASHELAPPGSVDLVLTFRNVHNWMAGGYAADVFAAAFRALRPGGVLGIVEHRASAGRQDPSARSGYVTEAFVIELASTAGFRLVERSEINANPADLKDYAKGVWTLPPSYALGETDRARYAAIGESDRMTLKFIKPAR